MPSASLLEKPLTSEHVPFTCMSEARTALLTLMARCRALDREAYAFTGGPSTAMSPSNSNRAMVSSDDYLSTSLFGSNTVGAADPATFEKTVAGVSHVLPGAITQELALGTTNALAAPPHLAERSIRLQTQLQSWHDALLAIMDTDAQASASLLTHYQACRLWLSTRLIGGEMVFDEYTHEFKEILRCAEIYLANRGERSTFTFEVGVVPPLYLVATKCRVPSIRRKAIELMKRVCLFRYLMLTVRDLLTSSRLHVRRAFGALTQWPSLLSVYCPLKRRESKTNYASPRLQRSPLTTTSFRLRGREYTVWESS